jgi:hypothetical protein
MSHDIIFDPPHALEIIHMISPYAPKPTPPPEPAARAPVEPPPSPPQRRRGGRPKGAPKPPPVPPEVAASPQARRIATVLLEVLAGLRSTGDAARTLEVTPVRFYAIETRAIGGLIAACEPRPSGIQPEVRDAHELTRLREQLRRQGQELNQVRSVLRTTQRQLGVATAPEPLGAKPGKPGKDGKPATKHKVRRPTVRALTMVRRLLQADTAAGSSPPAATPAPATPLVAGG